MGEISLYFTFLYITLMQTAISGRYLNRYAVGGWLSQY